MSTVSKVNKNRLIRTKICICHNLYDKNLTIDSFESIIPNAEDEVYGTCSNYSSNSLVFELTLSISYLKDPIKLIFYSYATTVDCIYSMHDISASLSQ